MSFVVCFRGYGKSHGKAEIYVPVQGAPGIVENVGRVVPQEIVGIQAERMAFFRFLAYLEVKIGIDRLFVGNLQRARLAAQVCILVRGPVRLRDIMINTFPVIIGNRIQASSHRLHIVHERNLRT